MDDSDLIELRGMALTAVVGVLPEERERAQPIEIDLPPVDLAHCIDSDLRCQIGRNGRGGDRHEDLDPAVADDLVDPKLLEQHLPEQRVSSVPLELEPTAVVRAEQSLGTEPRTTGNTYLAHVTPAFDGDCT